MTTKISISDFLPPADVIPLDREEAEIFADLRAGNYSLVKGFDRGKEKHGNYLSATSGGSSRNKSTKRSPITIRIPNDDLAEIKREAEETGTPYQTIIVSLLHRHVMK